MTVRSNRWYISLDLVKRTPVYGLTGVTVEDPRVKDLIRQVSKDIEEWCRPHTKATPTYFYPVTETRVFDHSWDTSRLKLDQWLLAVTSFTTKNGATAVPAASYDLMQWNQYGQKPYNLVRLRSEGTVPALLYTGTTRRANNIVGSWGYCDDTVATGATLVGALDDHTEEFDVDDGALIEVGWMLLVDNEQIFVESLSGNKITGKRGQDGTTATTHWDAAISRYAPPSDIEKLCGISVARLYHRGTTAWADTTGTRESGLPYFAANVPDAMAIIERYRRERWW